MTSIRTLQRLPAETAETASAIGDSLTKVDCTCLPPLDDQSRAAYGANLQIGRS